MDKLCDNYSVMKFLCDVFGICASCELQTLHYRIVFIVFVFTLLKTLFLFISLIFSFLIKFLTVFSPVYRIMF